MSIKIRYWLLQHVESSVLITNTQLHWQQTVACKT